MSSESRRTRPDDDGLTAHRRSQAPSPLLDRPVQRRRGAGSPFMQTRSETLPPRKTAPPAVVMRKADGAVAEPLPFTGISAEAAEWAFLPHKPGVSPPAPVQARGAMGGASADAVQMAEQRSIHESAAAGVSGSGGSLPHAERIQAAFGPAHDVSHVRAHVGGAAAAASAAIGAEAYATGNHIAFRQAPDLHTAAHEAAHIIQQRHGVALKGGVGQVGDVYERHADAVADRVVAGHSAADLLTAGPGGGAHSGGAHYAGDRAASGAAGAVQGRFTYNGQTYRRGFDANTKALVTDPELQPLAAGIKILAGNRIDMNFASKAELMEAAEREQSTSGGKPLASNGVIAGLMVSDLEQLDGRVFGATCAHVLGAGSSKGMSVRATGRDGTIDKTKPSDWSFLEMEQNAKAPPSPMDGVTSRALWKDKTDAAQPPLPSQRVQFATGQPQAVAVGQTVHLLGPNGRRTFTVFEQGVGDGYWGLVPLDVEGQLTGANDHAQWDAIVDNSTASGTSGSCYFIDIGGGAFEPIGIHVGKTTKYDGANIAGKFPLVGSERAKADDAADKKMPRIIRMAAATEVIDQINNSEWAKAERERLKLAEQEDLKLRFAIASDLAG